MPSVELAAGGLAVSRAGVADVMYYVLIGTFIAIPILGIAVLIVARLLDSWNAYAAAGEDRTVPRWIGLLLLGGLVTALVKVSVKALFAAAAGHWH